jgi:hypothetical protein
MLWVRISIRARCTTLCDKVCQWFATGRWFSLGPPVSTTNETDCHEITEILLKVALNTIKQTNNTCIYQYKLFLLFVYHLCNLLTNLNVLLPPHPLPYLHLFDFNGSSKNGVWWLRSKIWGPYDIYDSDKWAFDGWQAFKAWRLMTDYKCR